MKQKLSRRDLLIGSSALVAGSALSTRVVSAAPAASAITPALIEAAKKEGKVVWYTSVDLPLAEKIAKSFEAKFPGIAVRVERTGAERVFQRIEAVLKVTAEATGGSYMRNPASERIFGGNLMTVHPLGGCTMGADRTSGVVNHKGQVFDAGPERDVTAVHGGLYVVDGAVVPRSIGVNPLLTITALTERAMIHFARDHNLGFDDAPRLVERVA